MRNTTERHVIPSATAATDHCEIIIRRCPECGQPFRLTAARAVADGVSLRVECDFDHQYVIVHRSNPRSGHFQTEFKRLDAVPTWVNDVLLAETRTYLRSQEPVTTAIQ